jgi:hypothetical protein
VTGDGTLGAGNVLLTARLTAAGWTAHSAERTVAAP